MGKPQEPQEKAAEAVKEEKKEKKENFVLPTGDAAIVFSAEDTTLLLPSVVDEDDDVEVPEHVERAASMSLYMNIEEGSEAIATWWEAKKQVDASPKEAAQE